MSQVELSAKVRPETGKEAAGRLRRQNMIPAILYGGDSQGNLVLAVDNTQIISILKKEGKNALINLKFEGEKQTDTVIIRDIQTHPVKHFIIHVDFLRISMDKLIEVTVPVHVTGEAIGVKLYGGILELVSREINIQCLPAKIPEFISVDVSGLAVGKSIHVSDIQLPEGVLATDSPEQIVASVVEKIAEEKAAPKLEEAAAGTEAAAEAPKAEEKETK